MFDDMLKKPCPYHKTPFNHTLEQCNMLKKYYISATVKDVEAKKDGGDRDVSGFPAVENVFLIFGGETVDMSNSQRKWERHEVLAAENTPPSFLDWSGDAITFSHEDHPNRIPNPGQYPLVVDLVIGNSRFSKVLMNGGSSLNILYAHTLRLMGIGLDQLRPSTTPFHGVTPGKCVQPLGQIGLPVWFGTPDNFRKETLTFEVVGFRGVYHAILGRPCYAKFMAVPNYTYLKMKMPGPKGVINVGSSIEHAFDYDVECMEHAEPLELDEVLVANLEKLVNQNLNPSAKHAGSFKDAEQTKEVPLDPAAPEGKALRSVQPSTRNKKWCSSTFSAPRQTSLRGVPRTCQASRGRSPSTPLTSYLTPEPCNNSYDTSTKNGAGRPEWSCGSSSRPDSSRKSFTLRG
jgi:hypothetical protein